MDIQSYVGMGGGSPDSIGKEVGLGLNLAKHKPPVGGSPSEVPDGTRGAVRVEHTCQGGKCSF